MFKKSTNTQSQMPNTSRSRIIWKSRALAIAGLILAILLTSCLVFAFATNQFTDPPTTISPTTTISTIVANTSIPGTEPVKTFTHSETEPEEFTEPTQDPTDAAVDVTEETIIETTGADPIPVETAPITSNTTVVEQPLPTTPPVHVHNYTDSIVSPTCTETGHTIHNCSCGDSYIDSQIEATGHTWSDWTVVKEATTSAEGEKARSCSYCDAREIKTISKIATGYIPSGYAISLNHTYLNLTLEESMSYPMVEDFGCFFDEAVMVYEGIVNNQVETTVYIIPEGYEDKVLGPDWTASDIDRVSDETRKAVKEAMTTFEELFNTKVLNGYSEIKSGSKSFIDGKITFSTDGPAARFEEARNYFIAIYNANISAGLYDGMSELEAVTRINNWICANISYQLGTWDADDVLNTGVAQCAGYTNLFHEMCSMANIQCKTVWGCVKTEDINTSACPNCHAWNEVRIGGNWYHIDVCYNDGNGNKHFLSETLWESRSSARVTYVPDRPFHLFWTY